MTEKAFSNLESPQKPLESHEIAACVEEDFKDLEGLAYDPLKKNLLVGELSPNERQKLAD